jgi:aminoglycoside phosphotransferase
MSSRAAPGSGGRHGRIRRVDWRVLLPQEAFGSVAVRGAPDPELVEALRIVAAELAAGDATRTGAHDLVVVAQATPGALADAAGCLRPGGWLYAELAAGGRGLRRGSRALRAAGLEEVEAHWHWPSHAGRREIAVLGDPASVRMALARRRSGPGARAKVLAARLLLRLGLLPLAVPGVSLLARRPGGEAAESPVAEALRRLPPSAGVRAPASILVVTPRFATSRHVVVLAAPRGEPSCAAVLKLPRQADERSLQSLEREAEALRALEVAPGAAPRLLGLHDVAGWPVLAETALKGTPLSPGVVRRDAGRALEAALAWTLAVPRAAPEPAELLLARLVHAPLAPLAELLAGADRDLPARTAERLAVLHGASLPPVLEHGDLSHPNLVVRGDGGLAVLDWELAEPRGLPLADLAFFVAYVASSRRRARDAAQHADALRAALAPAGFAWPVLHRYGEALGLERPQLEPLVLAAFARSAARLAERLDPDADDGATRSWISASRQLALWRLLAGGGA